MKLPNNIILYELSTGRKIHLKRLSKEAHDYEYLVKGKVVSAKDHRVTFTLSSMFVRIQSLSDRTKT